MQSIQSKLSVSAMTVNLRIFTEPRGLIRLLHFIFAVFAFATACSGSSSVRISYRNGTDTIATSWSYPYNLKNSQIILQSNNTEIGSVSDSSSVKPSAEFFVFTGITSMILAFIFTTIYVIFDNQYKNNWLLPIIDLVIIIIWTIFWLAGSSAWAKAVTDIRSQTSLEEISKRVGLCQVSRDCFGLEIGSYGSIISSVIFGFLNFVIWASSSWFVLKETKFFKNRTEQRTQQDLPFPPSSFSNMSSPTMEHEPQFR